MFFWTSSRLIARCWILVKQDHTVVLYFQHFYDTKNFSTISCTGALLNNGYVYTCTHTKHSLAPKSENLDKFHYLWVSITSFVILKMDSARLSVLTISGTNAREGSMIQHWYGSNTARIQNTLDFSVLVITWDLICNNVQYYKH